MTHIAVTDTGYASLAMRPHQLKQTHASQLSQASSFNLQNALSDLNATKRQGSDSDFPTRPSSLSIQYSGDPYHLYMDDSERSAKARKLAERLDGPIHPSNDNHFLYQGSMRDFLEAGLLTDPEFLDLAEKMNDEELQNLATTVTSMRLPATENYTSHNESDRTYKDKVSDFLEVLTQSDKADRRAILKQSAGYAEQIDSQHLKTFQRAVYRQDFSQLITLQKFQNHTSANDLQNYVSAVISSEEPAALTEQLEKMSNSTQHSLLNVYGLDMDLGKRLSQLAGPKGNNIPDALFSALGDMVDEIKTFPLFQNGTFATAWRGDEALQKDNEQSHGRDFALHSVTSTIDMLAQYDFSDEQLSTMGTDLNGLSNPEKRAYLHITAIGLEDMLKAEAPESAGKTLDDALAVVSELRNNQNVLSLVNSERYHDVTLLERPDIEEGLTVVALEGAAAFENEDTAISNSRLLLGATTDKVNMVNGRSVKGDESENLYSAKTLDVYKKDVGNLVSTLVAFENMRNDSTANDKMPLDEFTKTLDDMHSGVRNTTLKRVSDEITSDAFRNKVTKNTQFAFLSSTILQMTFDTQQDFAEAAKRFNTCKALD